MDIQEMIALVEGELINFNNKRNQKIIDTNATELNRMARDGELDGVKLTSSGSIMGDPEIVKKLRAMNLQSNTAAKELAKSMPKKDNVVPIKKKEDDIKEENTMEGLYIEDLLEAVSESMLEQYGYIDEGVLDAIKKGAKKVAGLFKKKKSPHDIAKEILNRRREKKVEPKKEQALIGTSKKEPLLISTSKRRRGRPKGSKNKTKLEPAVAAEKQSSETGKETAVKPAGKKRGRPLGSKNKERINGKEVVHRNRYPSKDQAATAPKEVKPEDIKEPVKSETSNTKVKRKVGRPKKVKQTVTILDDKDKAKSGKRAKNGRVSVGQIAAAGSNVLSKRTNEYNTAKANGASNEKRNKLYWRMVQAQNASKLPKTKEAAVQYRDRTAKNLLKYTKKADNLSVKNNKYSKDYEFNPKGKADYHDAMRKRNFHSANMRAFNSRGDSYKYAKKVLNNESLSETTKAQIMNMVESYLENKWQD